ncbi:MAG: SMC family ATPase [Thermoprotei archaeon]
MKILGIRLYNIRSYRDSVIVFPPKGITTIYGDVGTGKTTILSSISYALFGRQSKTTTQQLFARYAYPNPADLLRRGTSRGYVKILFEHNGKLIVVTREIYKSGKTYSDAGGSIEVYSLENGPKLLQRIRASATELTARILDILGLPETGKQGERQVLFTTAIYVPQFNVQEVLHLDDESRIRLVNAALGLEKYTRIRENIEEIVSLEINQELRSLRDREKLLAKILSDYNIEDIKKKLQKLEEHRKALDDKKKKTEREVEETSKTISELEEKQKKLEEKLRELHSIKKLIEENESRKRELVESLSRYLKDLGASSIDEAQEIVNKLIEREKELGSKRVELQKRRIELVKELENTRAKRRELESQRAELLKKHGGIEAQIRQYRELVNEKKREYDEIESLVKQGICPVCKQNIPHEHGYRLLSEKKQELESLRNRIKDLEKQLAVLVDTIKSVEKEIGDLDNRIGELEQEIEAVDNNVKKIEDELLAIANKKSLINRVKDTLEEISSIEKKISSLRESVEKLAGIENEYKAISEELSKQRTRYEELNRVLAGIREELGRVESEISSLKNEIERYEKTRREYEEIRRKKKFYEDLKDFLGDKLLKLVDSVEKTVRSHAYTALREYFIEYFSKLMEEHEVIQVDLTDDFKPVIRASVDGALHDIPLASGGQITSVSLAYRLALNTVARRMSRELRDSTLMLDEPTQGFSPERVEKLRQLLRDLVSGRASGQVIVVTHDQRLLEIGDCRIKLTIDTSRMLTSVEYEYCSISGMSFAEYRKLVEKLLKHGISTGFVEKSSGGFEPVVVEKSSGTSTSSDKPRNEKRSTNTRSRSLLDYFG